MTDADGKLVFEDLNEGIYLIRQKNGKKTYGVIAPFLVCVPMEENGEILYDIHTKTKGEEIQKITPTPVISVTPSPSVTSTAALARKHGYQIQTVSYGTLPENIKGDSVKMRQAFDLALAQTEESLRDIDWTSYGSILFISKSIGTAISSAYAAQYNLNVKNILFTPLADTFSFPLQGSIAFHGTADPWAETAAIQTLAEQKEVPLFLTKNANHSLETGDIQTDLSILKTTMDRVERFII